MTGAEKVPILFPPLRPSSVHPLHPDGEATLASLADPGPSGLDRGLVQGKLWSPKAVFYDAALAVATNQKPSKKGVRKCSMWVRKIPLDDLSSQYHRRAMGTLIVQVLWWCHSAYISSSSVLSRASKNIDDSTLASDAPVSGTTDPCYLDRCFHSFGGLTSIGISQSQKCIWVLETPPTFPWGNAILMKFCCSYLMQSSFLQLACLCLSPSLGYP